MQLSGSVALSNNAARILSFPKDVVLLIASFLDHKSKMALWSACRELNRIGKRERSVVWVMALHSFLTSDSVPRDSFGVAGTLDALALIPPDILLEALGALLADHPNFQPEVELLLFNFCFPVHAWLNCRMYCRFSSVALGTLLEEGDLDLGSTWNPLPAAVYLALCVVDFYLPQMLPSTQKGVVHFGLADECEERALTGRPKPDLLVRDGLQRLRAPDSSLDAVLWSVLKHLHPVRHFGTAVHVLDTLVSEYEATHIAPSVYESIDDVLKHGGFFQSAIDGRLHCLPFATLMQWLCGSEAEGVNRIAQRALRVAFEKELALTQHEVAERGESQVVHSFFDEEGDDLYAAIDGIANLLPNRMLRLLLGQSGLIGQLSVRRADGW